MPKKKKHQIKQYSPFYWLLYKNHASIVLLLYIIVVIYFSRSGAEYFFENFPQLKTMYGVAIGFGICLFLIAYFLLGIVSNLFGPKMLIISILGSLFILIFISSIILLINRENIFFLILNPIHFILLMIVLLLLLTQIFYSLPTIFQVSFFSLIFIFNLVSQYGMEYAPIQNLFDTYHYYAPYSVVYFILLLLSLYYIFFTQEAPYFSYIFKDKKDKDLPLPKLKKYLHHKYGHSHFPINISNKMWYQFFLKKEFWLINLSIFSLLGMAFDLLSQTIHSYGQYYLNNISFIFVMNVFVLSFCIGIIVLASQSDLKIVPRYGEQVLFFLLSLSLIWILFIPRTSTLAISIDLSIMGISLGGLIAILFKQICYYFAHIFSIGMVSIVLFLLCGLIYYRFLGVLFINDTYPISGYKNLFINYLFWIGIAWGTWYGIKQKNK